MAIWNVYMSATAYGAIYKVEANNEDEAKEIALDEKFSTADVDDLTDFQVDEVQKVAE